MKKYLFSHPWKLVWYKVFYFPIIYTIFKLSIPYEEKMRYKRKLFYDKFASYARDKFKLNYETGVKKELNTYDLGLFKICIYSDSQRFSIEDLEWNLCYEYFDILYPALNPKHFKRIFGKGPYKFKGMQSP